ncbi:trophoblast glycoprotein isoform X2 [Calliopsis andreniformis]|uniref:trophoblast glycoprotein isoform X2 n=1 Tax=Calliopsis andreniformis TaxID=337506 RepID=UPI003FCE6F0D
MRRGGGARRCPPFCVCDTWYGLQRASCISRHLYSIDTGAPNTVQALDLSDNVISTLNNFELANAGLTNLKYLNFSGNTISQIGLTAFFGLDGLTVLDLSKNHLYYILDNTFAENKNLQILKLSKNNFRSHLPKLQSPWLTELSLDSCQISHLPLDTFNGLPRIRHLDLANNLMIQMSSTVLQTSHFLKKLSLQGNPWSCNRIILNLQTYLKENDIEYDEICGKTVVKQSPQKFEKMILAPVRKQQNYHHSATVSESGHIKHNSSNTLNNKNALPSDRTSNPTIIANSINKILPYWLLFIGFLFGFVAGMIISYIWLSGMLSCKRRCRQRQAFNESSQRLSLLLNPYLQDHDSDATLSVSCPGTPPPPYRDVVLRPTLYRCPQAALNLNNNST